MIVPPKPPYTKQIHAVILISWVCHHEVSVPFRDRSSSVLLVSYTNPSSYCSAEHPKHLLSSPETTCCKFPISLPQ